jgi:capsular polysaccharide biosynthesis protein
MRYKNCCGAIARTGEAAEVRGAAGEDGQLRDLLQAALAAQRAGRLDDAQRLYRMALDRSPENIDALHMLGVVHLTKGEHESAERLIAAAEALCNGAIPAITHNLALVRAGASFARGEEIIRSLLAAREARGAPGIDPAGTSVAEQTTRLIAFYLPQFHRIPENDRWWGEGFTEWVNVRRASPNFDGHYQPHEAGEFGYYDLNDDRVLVRQAALARDYGISGFCFYYYWFSGRRLLEMPIDRLLRSGQPDFPYCLCWANENWSRNWDGGNRDLLVEQRYLPEDAESFIRGLLPHFADRRYIHVDGRPLLMVYRVGRIPDPLGTFATWKAVCRAHGVAAPYIVLASTFDDRRRPGDVAADAVAEFPPHGSNVSLALRYRLAGLGPDFKGQFVSYLQNITQFLTRPEPDYPHFPGIVPSWDNTARRQNDGLCMLESSPAAFELWLRELVYRASHKPNPDERLVFINAWNEWAEGCHLEPDLRYGRAWLEACRNARLIPREYRGIFVSASASAPRAPSPRRTRDFPLIDLPRPATVASPPEDDRAQSHVVTLFDGGAPLDDAPLLWRAELPERLAHDHEQRLVTPAVEVFCVTESALHGPGWVSKDDQVLFDPSLYPRYARDWYLGKRDDDAADNDLSRLIERRYPAGWHVSHFRCGVYGHWLSEVMPKLLVIREFLRRWPGYRSMPLFLPSVFPQFVYANTRRLLADVPVLTYDPQFEYLTFERLFMPTWGVAHVLHRWVGEQIDRIAAAPATDLPRRMFVSRRHKSAFRALDNLKQLETIAAEEGLAVVYPEDHPFERQIALFRNADVVVGEFGSALHNALFSRPGTLVVALNWINGVQSRIARLRRHRIGYLLPDSGLEVLFSPDAPVQHYTIDPDGFRAKLRAAMIEQSSATGAPA